MDDLKKMMDQLESERPDERAAKIMRRRRELIWAIGPPVLRGMGVTNHILSDKRLPFSHQVALHATVPAPRVRSMRTPSEP
jgi:hypothetical protein